MFFLGAPRRLQKYILTKLFTSLHHGSQCVPQEEFPQEWLCYKWLKVRCPLEGAENWLISELIFTIDFFHCGGVWLTVCVFFANKTSIGCLHYYQAQLFYSGSTGVDQQFPCATYPQNRKIRELLLQAADEPGTVCPFCLYFLFSLIAV